MLFLCDLKLDHYIHYKNIRDDNKRVNIDVYERIKKSLCGFHKSQRPSINNSKFQNYGIVKLIN